MIRIFVAILLILTISVGVRAADLEVERIIEVTQPEDGVFNAPKLSPDGTYIAFSGERYVGLYKYDLNTNTLTRLTDEPGAGYRFSISPDGSHIFYRSYKYDGIRRFFSLKRIDVNDKSVEIIESDKRNLTPPDVSKDGNLNYLMDGNLNKKFISNTFSDNTNQNTQMVYIRDRKIVLVTDGREKILEPLGEGIYVWPSLSPDGQRLLFTKAGEGTFISDLNGNIIEDLGYANAPQWSPDGEWIAYMKDIDDGHRFVESDIFIRSTADSETIKITNTTDTIEMHPSWGNENRRIVFTSAKGQIFMAELKITK